MDNAHTSSTSGEVRPADSQSMTTKEAFCDGLKRIADGSLSDFTLKCNQRQWAVHRVVITLHSAVLGESCGGEFKEAKQRVHDLSEYTEEYVDALVNYMYTFDYRVSDNTEYSAQLCFHVNICIIADKYDIAGLKKLAGEKFRATIDEIQKGQELVDAALAAYDAEGATTKIRRIMAIWAVQHEDVLPGGSDGDALEKTMETHPRLAIDIIKARDEKTGALANEYSQYQCPHFTCEKTFKANMATTSGDKFSCPRCTYMLTKRVWNAKFRIGAVSFD